MYRCDFAPTCPTLSGIIDLSHPSTYLHVNAMSASYYGPVPQILFVVTLLILQLRGQARLMRASTRVRFTDFHWTR